MFLRRRNSTGIRCWLSAVLASAALLLAAAPAAATTGDVIAPQHPPAYTASDGWQAGTCSEEPPESAAVCSVATPGQFFERAAAHPNWGFTQFIVKHTTETVGPLTFEKPVGELADVRVDLPVGLSVNPGAAERCPLTTFEAGASAAARRDRRSAKARSPPRRHRSACRRLRSPESPRSPSTT